MFASDRVTFEIAGNTLTATEPLDDFISSLPDEVKEHHVLRKMGLLTEQLFKYDANLSIETQHDTAPSKEDVNVILDKEQADIVTERAKEIEQSLTNKSNEKDLINEVDALSETDVTALIEEFWNNVVEQRPDFTSKRLRAFKIFCVEAGFVEHEAFPEQPDIPESESDYNYEGPDVDWGDVSKR